MNKYQVLFMSILFAGGAYANEPPSTDYKPAVGWQFYNLPKPPKEKPVKPQPEISSALKELSPSEQLELIQKKLKEARDTAIMNPTADNIAIYKVYQDYFVEKATAFSMKWEEMLLKYPDLDYNLKNSFYNATVPIKETMRRKEEAKAIEYVNQRYGFFFFYRGHNPIDNKLAEVVKNFSAQYKLTIIPISVDGRISAEFPNSRKDMGQAAKMSVNHFPAIFLVNPTRGEYKPLAYGFITPDDLARRVLNVVSEFKPKI
ncbi:conjugal transfer protein TraF [Rodentibacter sp. JRC1]|uniref:type-F conjugative transfer system pilin assembly protein TraF n=1 Tax=Rodentibacter sp. JRC1 TaxID=2874504 RepID=UPI001CFDFF42|nr:type-F conjugative transfer system pilin assembly protein TraF [Rodentibacter sp. JRC1]GJI56964.1 conjugal transfer protein TraF [Rodentibacter sp. JRC1]